MRNQPQLITYVDRLTAGTFRDLERLLTGSLARAFSGVHVLPFFDPIDGADAGFDPIDHTRVDPRLGTWDDVRALASHTDIMRSEERRVGKECRSWWTQREQKYIKLISRM